MSGERVARESNPVGAYYSGPWAEVHAGDCVELMRGMPENVFDAIITDPPYGLEFMNKSWDRLGGEEDGTPGWQAGGGFSMPGIGERERPWPSFSATSRFGAANPTCARCGGRGRGKKRCSCPAPEWKPIGKRRKHHDAPEGMTGTGGAEHGKKMQRWHERWAREALRVLKPGGHLFAFGGARTSHRLACAVEDAGFEVLDGLEWLYGQGNPKGRDVRKALTRLQGEKRRAMGMVPLAGPESARTLGEGWHTALKPAHEPIVRARKPLAAGTVALNVLRHGTGALNVGACRIGGEEGDGVRGSSDATVNPERPFDASPNGGNYRIQHPLGRWPANVIVSCCEGETGEDVGNGLPCASCPVAELDRQSGLLQSGANPTRRSSDKHRDVYSPWKGRAECEPARGEDAGGASRFFYVAKASKAEREEGLDGFEERPILWSNGAENPGSFQSEGSTKTSKNPHPTVKPEEIVRWLIRLAVGGRPGAVILDPFAGSGTTAVAATLEDVRCVLAEREEEYLPVIVARAKAAGRKGPRPGEPLGIKRRRVKPPEPDPLQLALAFGEEAANGGGGTVPEAAPAESPLWTG